MRTEQQNIDKRGSINESGVHLAVQNIEMLIAKIFGELIYVIFFIESIECIGNVRIGYVTLAECVAEVARVEVQDLLDDALTIPILKLRSRLEKIKPGVSQSNVPHNLSEI